MKLGVLVESEEGLDWERWRTTFKAAEHLGFDSVWISDHLASPWSEERYGLEAWVALSVAAAETGRIRLGTLVSPITFRPPAIMGRMAEALADLSHDRFVLGLGLGWNAQEHARFAIPFPSASARAELFANGIDRIRASVGPDRVPLLIGGSGPRSTLPLVARFADWWNLTIASASVYRERSRVLATLCKEIQRDPRTIRRSVAVGFIVGQDEVELRARRSRLADLVPPLASVADPADLGWVAGTPAQIVAALAPLADAGVELAILGHYDPSDVTALELIARDVLPALA